MVRPIRFRRFSIRFFLFVPAVVFLGWGFLHRETISVKVLPTPAPVPELGEAGVWFSRPQEFDGRYAGGPEQELILALDRARCCVDAAVYDIDLLPVARALLRASARGVAVRIVTDTDNLDREAVGLLRGGGIPVVGDNRDGLMHDKFVVIDRGDVWAGSMNLTGNDAYLNDNNFFHVRSPELAELFTAEFGEMFVEKFFGTDSPRGPLPAAVETGVGPVQALFAPDNPVARRVIELIHGAKESVHFLAFSFTSSQIADALVERAAAGVEVSGVMETSQAKSNSGAQWNALHQSGVKVYLDANPHNMHDKVILIDGKIVITGSYNFTESAENKNDEDLLILWNAGWAAMYQKDFRRIYDLAVQKAAVSCLNPTAVFLT
jgi:phosphatidylserine/phosphatidylglycerophosphate/cardiolipin synthase-like enzyme